MPSLDSPLKYLLHPDEFRRLRAAAGRLPPTSGNLLECHLAPDATRIDLSLRLLADDSSHEFCVGRTPAFSRATRWLNEPAWQHVRALCEAWTDTASPVHQHVEVVWLEFDRDSFSAEIPLPSLFVGSMCPGAMNKQVLAYLLTSWSLDQLDLTRYIDSLPETAYVRHIGSLFARGGELVRLCVFLPLITVLGYLRNVHWQGAYQKIEALLHDMADFANGIVLHLDIGPALSNTIGIEFWPSNAEFWPPLLESLVEQGLCPPQKRDGLLAWPGHSSHFDDPQASQSDFLIQTIDAQTPRDSIVYVRRLSHLKFVVAPDGLVESKCYLYTGYGVFRPQ